LLEDPLAATGLCTEDLTPGGLVGRGGTAALSVRTCSIITTPTVYKQSTTCLLHH